MPYITRSYMIIYPVLAVLQNSQQIPKLNLSNEVDFIFWTKLKNFLSSKHYKFSQLDPDICIHYFMV